jgi:hypothetical protein
MDPRPRPNHEKAVRMNDDYEEDLRRAWRNHPMTARLHKTLRLEVARLSDAVCALVANGDVEQATRAALRRHALQTVVEELENG